MLFSCRSTESEHLSSSKATVKVQLSGASYENASHVTAYGGNDLLQPSDPMIQRAYVPINKDLNLLVKLSPSVTENTVQSGRKISPMATEQGNLPQGIKYKVAVFDHSGLYVTERDYTRGNESATEALNLDGGSAYTFIAYSVGSSSEFPEMSYTDPNHKTLSSASLSQISGDSDFMYFRKDMEVIGNEENNLDVVLKHRFSQISTKIDATTTGYTISSISAAIDSHYPKADITLSDAAIVRSGSSGNASLSFSGLGTAVLTAAPKILNGDTSSASFLISNISIGSVTKTNLVPMNNLKITPGYKYDLNLSIVPNDLAMVHLDTFAIRISGKIWMRHNLGADTSLDPDQNPTVRGLIGNYYQYGRSTVVATSDTGNGAISGWNTTQAADNAWNSGTEDNPVKTAQDPCPSGWRIPTRPEMQSLIDNTTTSNIGTWATNGNANTIGAAKVFTSKTNANARLTFPATGYRTANNGSQTWRGGSGLYWSSILTSSTLTRLSVLQNSVVIGNGNSGQPNNIAKTSGFAIRCIAE